MSVRLSPIDKKLVTRTVDLALNTINEALDDCFRCTQPDDVMERKKAELQNELKELRSLRKKLEGWA